MAEKNNTTRQFEKAARDRYICNLYFGEKKTQREISILVGLTQKQVSKVCAARKAEWANQQDEEELRQVIQEDVVILDATISAAVTNYAESGDPKTGKLITELMARKAKLLGLDSPAKAAITKIAITPIIIIGDIFVLVGRSSSMGSGCS